MTSKRVRRHAGGNANAVSADEALIHGGDEETVADTVGEHATQLESTDAPGTPPRGITSRRPTRVMIVPLIAALLFYFAPALGFVAGDRATELENRKLTDFPAISAGWKFIPQFQLWANDHLPLRGAAISAGTEISEKIYNEPPNYGQNTGSGVGVGGAGGAPASGSAGKGGPVQYPKVIEGKDGWLYFGGDVSDTCNPKMSVPAIIAAVQKLSDAITKSGRKFVLAVSPDKSSIETKYLPDEFAGQKCMEERKKQFWSAVSGLQGVTVVDPRAALVKAGVGWDEPVYRKNDTHWAPRGALAFAEQLATTLDPKLLEQTTFTSPGTTNRVGDLSTLLGQSVQDTYKQVVLNRTGTTMYANGAPVPTNAAPGLTYSWRTITSTATAGGAALYPGKTMLLGDSFFAASVNMVAPFYSSISYIHNQTFLLPGATKSIVNHMYDTDTVVLEIVERSLVGGAVTMLDAKTIAAIEAGLAAHPK